MKTFNKWMAVLISGLLLLGSCSEYLDKTPESDVTDEDIFGNYRSFQGFVDPMYSHVVDYVVTANNNSGNLGGETHSVGFAVGSRTFNTGQYSIMYRETGSNVGQTFWNFQNRTGIWTGSWKGIRIANITLEKLPLLVNATQEEKDLIAGQAYFFRAFFYWELAKAVGGLPYIDKVITPTEEMKFPRLTYQETTERIVEDFDKAVQLLPVNWDNTVVGGSNPGSNTGRATKGAALAFKAKALLFAGSPLMNKFSGASDYVYDTDYMKRAADAAWEVIKLGAYSLVPFSNYQDNFAKNDGTYPYTTETIFMYMDNSAAYRGGGSWARHGSIFNASRFGGAAVQENVNQMYVDKFEMKDGTRYKIEYDMDNARRWDDRDPRFRQNILVDRDRAGIAASTLLKLYVGAGTEKTAANQYVSPYVIKKYWKLGVNNIDRVNIAGFYHRNPHMRLADVYLIYAEAVNEAYGPTGKAPEANLTAIDAVNEVRRRAGMPDVTATSYIAAGYDSFRDLIRNERNVELCFEGHYWYDIRRWYIGHLPENKDFVDLEFDAAWTPSSFVRKTTLVRVFENPKHYWMPLPNSQTQIYKEFYQNPGW
jgi:starch-binding outer membrane protein, SusD/RagB family